LVGDFILENLALVQWNMLSTNKSSFFHANFSLLFERQVVSSHDSKTYHKQLQICGILVAMREDFIFTK